MSSFTLKDKNKTSISPDEIVGVELIIKETIGEDPNWAPPSKPILDGHISHPTIPNWQFNMFTKYYIIELVYEEYDKAKIDNEALKRIVNKEYST